jgi:hypothetical protein
VLDLAYSDAAQAQNQLHPFLKEKDARFGGLVRVRNKRQEFLWVHLQFEAEYYPLAVLHMREHGASASE